MWSRGGPEALLSDRDAVPTNGLCCMGGGGGAQPPLGAEGLRLPPASLAKGLARGGPPCAGMWGASGAAWARKGGACLHKTLNLRPWKKFSWGPGGPIIECDDYPVMGVLTALLLGSALSRSGPPARMRGTESVIASQILTGSLRRVR